MKIDTEQIFVLTNPIFWLWAIVLFIIYFIQKFLEVTGIYDWYYVLFKFDKMSKKVNRTMIHIFNNRPKMFWLKRKAWELAEKKFKKLKLD